jgi:hypothetical protein
MDERRVGKFLVGDPTESFDCTLSKEAYQRFYFKFPE